HLINKAIDNLDENADEIIRLHSFFKTNLDESNLLQRIDHLYENHETRPYALLMKIEYLNFKGLEIDPEVIEEIESYTYIEEVAEFLFFYKGQRLYDP